MTSGDFHDQGDDKWIVIRRSLWGHNDRPCRWPAPAGLSATRGLAAHRAKWVILVTID
jgi:hypothetical protein